jgi:hypothetical protein
MTTQANPGSNEKNETRRAETHKDLGYRGLDVSIWSSRNYEITRLDQGRRNSIPTHRKGQIVAEFSWAGRRLPTERDRENH